MPSITTNVAAASLRPFYFMVVVWGERYCDFLLRYCLASLLSPNNVPALKNHGNKLLIATTKEDRLRLEGRPMLQKFARYCEVEFIDIPPCPPEISACIHMGIGHKKLTQLAFENRAYGVVLTPDMMNSDGTVAAMQMRALEGYEVMLTVALRFAEEPLFDHLRKIGVFPAQESNVDPLPIVATGRQLAWAGLRSFHSETLCYEWEQPYFAEIPSAVWWRVPEEDGIVVHSLSWAPMLVDYGAIERHDSSVMDEWTIDGDYIHKNFGVKGKVYVVQDSDELMQVSWAPLEDRRQELKPNPAYTPGLMGEWAKGRAFHKSLNGPMFDPLKRELFIKPVYWHGGKLRMGRWLSISAKAQRTLRIYGYNPAPHYGAGLHFGSIYKCWGEVLRFLFGAYIILRMYLEVTRHPYAMQNSDGLSAGWVNIPLAHKSPSYNRAANEWLQEQPGRKSARREITNFILGRMAELDQEWGKDFSVMKHYLGWAIWPTLELRRFTMAVFRYGDKLAKPFLKS